MTKIYQTIINKTNGNCLAATWASLLNLSLSEVPNFIEEEDCIEALIGFVKKFGYEYAGYMINENRNDLSAEIKAEYNCFKNLKDKSLPIDCSIEGYYNGLVKSSFSTKEGDGICHAVVVDQFLNIVHDPNPNNKFLNGEYPDADVLGYNGLIGVCLFQKKL
jgi:hypothetical protein